MHENVNWNLLAKYLFGEDTAQDAAEIQAWLDEKPEHRKLLSELEEIKEATGPDAQERDVDALWQRLRPTRRLRGRGDRNAKSRSRGRRPAATPVLSGEPAGDRGARREERAGNRSVSDRRLDRRRKKWRFYQAAAALIAVACIALVVLWRNGVVFPDGSAAQGKVFSTERGQRATVRLADGTVAHLNAASSLALASSFEQVRSVQLEGEAYFEVARDTSRPFVVHTGRTTARVLGTKFSVNAYPDDEQVRVVVAEGKVAFRAEKRAQGGVTEHEAGVILTARQMGELSASGRVSRSSADPARYLKWMVGDIYFQDAPFNEVIRRLSRRYNIEVKIDEASVPDGHLNARFSERQSLEEVLGVVCTTFQLRFEQTGDHVRLYSTK